MADEGDFLDLADFTGLLIDNTLSALIKSLESQIQWREQITALDHMSEEEVVASISDGDVDDWLLEIAVGLPDIFAKWSNIKPDDKLELNETSEMVLALMEALEEISEVLPEFLETKMIVFGREFEAVHRAIKLHLAVAAKSRLSLMKEMGLPALVADRIEIKSKMNLISERKTIGGVVDDNTTQSVEGESGSKDETAKWVKKEGESIRIEPIRNVRSNLAKPVKTQLIGSLTDLEKIRKRIPATLTHSVKIAASPTAQNSSEQNVNAEISIILKSHFF